MRYVAIDLETVGLRPYRGTIWMLAYNDGKKVTVYHNCNGMSRRDIPREVVKVLEDDAVCKIVHSSEFDLPYLQLSEAGNGTVAKEAFVAMGITVRNIWDTRLCEQVILGRAVPRGNRDQALNEAYSASLQYTLKRYGLAKLDKGIRANFVDRPRGLKFTKTEIDYAASDVKDLLELQKAQEFILTRDGLIELALLENRCAERIAQMRVNGIGFSKERWIAIAKRNSSEFEKRQGRLPSSVANWNSTSQVKAFFKKRGILINSYDELDAVLEATGDEVLRDFISARSLHKAVTSYGLNWLEEGYVDADSRIRCNVEQIINTGRMSMSNPNLQQLPANGAHRSAFVPKKGQVFVIGDFTGQEIGIMAAASDEKIWVDALLRGDDVHSLTASVLYGNEWAEGKERGCKFPKKCSCTAHKNLRNSAKVLNFMLAYGGGPQKFAEKTGVTEMEARVIVNRYKRIIPRLTKWLFKNGQDALNTGESYSADPYRRRRVLAGDEEWHIVNQGKNSPIQAAGANMLKLTMVSLPEEFPVVLVIHDEVVLEVPTSKAKKAVTALKAVMEKSADYITGIKGIIKVTPRIAKDLTKE